MVKERLHDIDVAKGFAIFLVVFGHIVARPPVPAGNEWYLILKYLIYKFHMPFFMFLSGLIMYYSYKPVGNLNDYYYYVKKKFMRLIPAFLLFGIIIGVGKYIFKNFMYVDNAIADPFVGFMNLLIRPMYSYAASLWYVYVLFSYFFIMPLLIKLVKGNLKVLIFIGALVHFVPMTKYFAIDLVLEYMFVFSLGMFCADNIISYQKFLDKNMIVFTVLFLLSLVLAFAPIGQDVSKFFIGIFSIPAIWAIVRNARFFSLKFWEILGKYTFPIYLMNTIAIGLAKGVMTKFMPWDGVNFLIIAPILLLSGVYLPIIVKTMIFSKVPVLDNITN